MRLPKLYGDITHSAIAPCRDERPKGLLQILLTGRLGRIVGEHLFIDLTPIVVGAEGSLLVPEGDLLLRVLRIRYELEGAAHDDGTDEVVARAKDYLRLLRPTFVGVGRLDLSLQATTL